MKKLIQYTVIALVGILWFSACTGEEEKPLGGGHFQRCFIAFYIVPQDYQAQFSRAHPKVADDVMRLHVTPSSDKAIYYSPLADKKELREKHEEYARRYQDTAFNRVVVPPPTSALAEPLDSIRCYALSTDGSMIDISESIKCLSGTYLPYIRSGDRDDLVPPAVGILGKLQNEYQVYKPLKELTKEDLTLVASGRFWLETIPPYQFDSDVLVRVFSSADEPKEVIAKYNFPKGK